MSTGDGPTLPAGITWDDVIELDVKLDRLAFDAEHQEMVLWDHSKDESLALRIPLSGGEIRMTGSLVIKTDAFQSGPKRGRPRKVS